MENQEQIVKMITKSGQVIALYCDVGTLDELISHPKFLKMRDTGNDVYMSIEDIVAFENLSTRKQDAPAIPQEQDGEPVNETATASV